VSRVFLRGGHGVSTCLQGLGYSKTCVSGQYACAISLTYAMMSGDGPVARDLVAQAGSLRTLVMAGDRRVADMATARADAVDAAPAGSIGRALREDLVPGSAAEAVESKQESHSILKRKREEAELAKIEADREAFLAECLARQDDARARQDEAKARKLAAQASIEAAEHALEQGRRQRSLEDAETQRQVQLQIARQTTQLQAEVAAGAISEEAARALLPTRRRIGLERFVTETLRGDLAAYRARLQSANKTEMGLAQELGRRAKAALLNGTRFAAKPPGDAVGGGVVWFEEDRVDLFALMKDIVQTWTALPEGQTTLQASRV